MRSSRLLLAVLLVLGGTGCSSDPFGRVAPGGAVTLRLRPRSGAAVPRTPWTVVFDSVMSDSRCPIGALCIQAGEAVLALELASPLADPLPQDSPHFSLGSEPVEVEGLRFSQVDVQPMPRIGVKINPADYLVTIRVDRIFMPE